MFVRVKQAGDDFFTVTYFTKIIFFLLKNHNDNHQSLLQEEDAFHDISPSQNISHYKAGGVFLFLDTKED